MRCGSELRKYFGSLRVSGMTVLISRYINVVRVYLKHVKHYMRRVECSFKR